MFVDTEFPGKGLGYALANAIIVEAKNNGCSSIKLNTDRMQIEAQNLYEHFGFKKTDPFYELPEKLRNWLN